MSSSQDKGKKKAARPFEDEAGAAAADNGKVDTLAYLQGQLIASGHISRPLDVSRLSDGEARRLEKCLNGLLAKAAADLASQTSLMARYHNLASEFERIESQVGRSKQALTASEEEKEQAKARAASAVKDLEREVARHTQAREEAAKARSALATVKSTAQHENKRRENELATTLTRWQKVSAASQATITINSPDSIARASRDYAAKNGSPEVRFLEESLKQLEDARVVVQEENVQLREVIGDVVNEVRATLASVGSDMPSLSDSTNGDSSSIPQPHLALPPDSLTEYLSKLFLSLRDASVGLKQLAEEEIDNMHRRSEEAVSDQIRELEGSLAAMQIDLDEARTQAREAEASVQRLTAELEKERKGAIKAQSDEAAELRKQRKALEAERKKTSEVLAKLAEERAQLEKERPVVKEASRVRSESPKKQPAAVEPARPPLRVRKAPSLNTLRQSSTASALQAILDGGKDTPPQARPLGVGLKREKAKTKTNTEEGKKLA